MSESTHDQREEETAEEREETMKDLDVPENTSEDVKGGSYDIKKVEGTGA